MSVHGGGAASERPASPAADRRRALTLALLAFVVFNLNGRLISAGDTYPARFLPFALWGWGTVFLDPVVDLARMGHPVATPADLGRGVDLSGNVPAYWLVPTLDGHVGSFYPIVTPLVVAPFYAPAAAYLTWRGWSPVLIEQLAPLMEKLTASAVAALAVGVMYLALRRRAAIGVASWLALAFAFGTTTWSVSAQGLWPHGLAELLAALGLLLQSGPSSLAAAALAGLLCGLLPANRPPDLVLAAGLAAHALLWLRGPSGADERVWQRYLAYGLTGAAPLVATAAFNLHHFGSLGGGYVAGGTDTADFFRHPMLAGVAGLLVSPARGWLVYSPFLSFAVLRLWPARRGGARQGWSHRASAFNRIDICLAAAVLAQLLLYACSDWRAGWSWGPRFLTDALPFTVWLLAPVWGWLRPPGRAAFGVCVLLAVAGHWVGAFRYQGGSERALFAGDRGPRLDFRPAWRLASSPILFEAREAPPERPLFRLVAEPLAHAVGLRPRLLISDGFESGDTAAWSRPTQLPAPTTPAAP